MSVLISEQSRGHAAIEGRGIAYLPYWVAGPDSKAGLLSWLCLSEPNIPQHLQENMRYRWPAHLYWQPLPDKRAEG